VGGFSALGRIYATIAKATLEAKEAL